METLFINKNGKLSCEIWNDGGMSVIDIPPTDTSKVLTYLNHKIKLSKRFTFLSWLKLLGNYPVLCLVHDDLPTFVSNHCNDRIYVKKGISGKLRISKVLEVMKDEGVMIQESTNVYIKNNTPNWDIDINKYLNTPIVLGKGYRVNLKLKKEKVISKYKKFNTSYTLWDLVSSLSEDILGSRSRLFQFTPNK